MILLLGTAVNLVGRQALKIFMIGSIIAEVVGSVGLGTWLLLFHRHNGLDVLPRAATPAADTVATFVSGPFLLAVAFIGWSFVGFESAGAIAEEVHEPRKNLPKAVLFSLTFIAIVVAYSSLAIILAIPDLAAVATGTVADPVYETLTTALGRGDRQAGRGAVRDRLPGQLPGAADLGLAGHLVLRPRRCAARGRGSCRGWSTGARLPRPRSW